MKIYLLLLGIGISFLSVSCVSRLITIPARTYCFEEQDSSLVKNNSINIDSLRILLMSRISLLGHSDLLVRSTKSGVEIREAPFTPKGMTSTTTVGVAHNKFMDISILKVTQRLQEITDVWLMQDVDGEISSSRLDSIVRDLNIDLVIAADGISYGIQSYAAFSNHTMDNYVRIKASMSYAHSQETRSRGTCVSYKSHWTLLWIDPQSRSVERKQRIVQTGQFYSTIDGKDWIGEIFSCSLRVADDFAKIFK